MIDIEKFLVSLRSNKDLDGKLKPIYLADTVQEEIKIIQAAVENSRQEWVGLTDDEIAQLMFKCDVIVTGPTQFDFAQAIEVKLKEKNPVHASDEFKEMVEKGTKAWADTPDDWVDDLRGGVEKREWVGLDPETMRNTTLQFNQGALWAERYLKEKNT
jgi:hypothetical protein